MSRGSRIMLEDACMIDNPSADADFGVAADESGELNDGSAFLATLNTALTWSKVWYV